jgi:hypothetical protein
MSNRGVGFFKTCNLEILDHPKTAIPSRVNTSKYRLWVNVRGNNKATDAGPYGYHNVAALERDRPLYSINSNCNNVDHNEIDPRKGPAALFHQRDRFRFRFRTSTTFGRDAQLLLS